VQLLGVALELKVRRDGVAGGADGIPARVLHRRGEEAHGAAAQRRCAGRILGHGLEVVVPDVGAAAALVVLVLAHVAGVGCVEDLVAEEDVRRESALRGEVELVEDALNLGKEAVVVVIRDDQQHAARRAPQHTQRTPRRTYPLRDGHERRARALQHRPRVALVRIARALRAWDATGALSKLP